MDNQSTTGELVFCHKEASFERLTHKNYNAWSRNCRLLLCALDIWSIVDNEEDEPQAPVQVGAIAVSQAVQNAYRENHREYKRRAFRATQIIHNSVSDDLRPYISNTDEPSEMWAILQARCSSIGTQMERTALLLQFNKTVPVSGAPISEYFSKLMEIRNQLAGSPQAITDTAFKVQIYGSLPPEFDTTITYQQNLPDDTSTETIMDNLKRDELMRTMRNKPAATTEALYSNSTSNRGRGRGRGRGGRKQSTNRWCNHCKRNSHNTEDCWNKDSEDSGKRSHDEQTQSDEPECWHCGETGHMVRDCPTKQKGEAAKERNAKRRKMPREEAANLSTKSAGSGL
jgi:hypothetical protein